MKKKSYPKIQALIKRARWHASIRMRISPDADTLSELDAYGWIGVLTAVRAGHRGPGYLYRSAYNQMVRDYWRQRHADAHRFAGELDAAQLGVLRAPDARQLSDDLADALFNMFLASRKKRGQRGVAASERDVHIVALLVAGFSNEGIGLELGVDAHDVAHYRRQIQNRLLTTARGCDMIKPSAEAGETARVV